MFDDLYWPHSACLTVCISIHFILKHTSIVVCVFLYFYTMLHCVTVYVLASRRCSEVTTKPYSPQKIHTCPPSPGTSTQKTEESFEGQNEKSSRAQGS